MGPLIFSLALGAFAGFSAGLLMRGRGHGVLGNLSLGLLGGALGGWCVRLTGFDPASSLALELVTSIFGAALLLFLAGREPSER